MSKIVDAMGQKCPIPVIMAKKEIAAGETAFTVPEDVQWETAQLVIGSNAPEVLERELKLAPWSASVWSI